MFPTRRSFLKPPVDVTPCAAIRTAEREASYAQFTHTLSRGINEKHARHRTMSRIYHSLYDRLLHRRALAQAFAKVRRARGAPGVDGQTIADFAANVDEEVKRLVHELRTKTYRPQPVRRVTIPKPGGGERHLGIPAVRDRVVQQALLDILQPIFDPDFHPSSYGYRPGRSCQQAVAKAAMFVRRYHLVHVVDMDLSKCFDRLDHDLIVASFRRRVRDGSILALVRLFLESGVMIEGDWEATEIGSPQGGVMTPPTILQTSAGFLVE
jgi:RNA-directed DNA polymerase